MDLPTTGRIRVRTASGTEYLIDLADQRLQRLPGVHDKVDGWPTGNLRRDGGWIKILKIHRLVVGECAIFVLEPLGDPAVVDLTVRETTPVVSIETERAAADELTSPR